METSVDFVVQDAVGEITFRRPQARNALTWEAMEAFAACVEKAAAQTEMRALIVTGAGGAFCAGGDLFELDGYLTFDDGVRLSTIMAQALDRLEAIAIPTIAAIEGPALGGGAEIALACDLRVMAEGATLGMMHVRLGITPAWGGGQRLLRLAGYARTLEWLAEGRVLVAEEARLEGLANRVVPKGEALSHARSLAGNVIALDPHAVRAVKRIARAGVTLNPVEAMRLEQNAFPDLWAAHAHREASAAFLASRNHRPRPEALGTQTSESTPAPHDPKP